MRDDWDIAPWIPPLGPMQKQVMLGEPCEGEDWGRSPEEGAAEEQKWQESYGAECHAHVERYKEVMTAWRPQRVKRVQERLKFLQRYQEVPGSEPMRMIRRRNCWRDEDPQRALFDTRLDLLAANLGLEDCVYCGWCPKRDAYKVGHTKSPWKRFRHHLRKLDPDIDKINVYYTPVCREALEQLLLRHFRHCQVQQEGPKELFKLSQEEVGRFGAVVYELENYLLKAEIFRLKDRLLTLKAECQ